MREFTDVSRRHRNRKFVFRRCAKTIIVSIFVENELKLGNFFLFIITFIQMKKRTTNSTLYKSLFLNSGSNVGK